jgi:hypothetical protein
VRPIPASHPCVCLLCVVPLPGLVLLASFRAVLTSRYRSPMRLRFPACCAAAAIAVCVCVCVLSKVLKRPDHGGDAYGGNKP